MGLKRITQGLFKKLALLHNTLTLVGWLYVEVLLALYFYRHLNNGLKFDFKHLYTLDLFQYIGRDLKFVTLFHALNLLFLLDNRKEKNVFLSLLLHHLKALLMYFFTMRLVDESVNFRWFLTNVAVWTLLNVLDCLNRFNLFFDHKNEFVEWVYHKVFMLLYPLLTLSELMLVTGSYGNLKKFDKFKAFPSPMPNKLNFSLNLHLIYKLLPAPLLLFSMMEYFKKCKYN